jgi:hypothetical protein
VVSATVEFALVVVGAWTYWQAAREVTLAAGYGQRRAIAAAVLILIGGTLLLFLDFTGVGG